MSDNQPIEHLANRVMELTAALAEARVLVRLLEKELRQHQTHLQSICVHKYIIDRGMDQDRVAYRCTVCDHWTMYRPKDWKK